MARRKKGSTGAKIIIAILAIVGIVAILDMFADTHILQSLWDSFWNFWQSIADKMEGA